MKPVPLAKLAQVVMGQSPPSSTYNTDGEGLPFFQGKADFGDLYPTVRMFCTEPKKIAKAGDILISVRAPVGPTNISPEKSCIGRGLAAIRSSQDIDRDYLLYFLRSHEPKLTQHERGSTFGAISRNDLESILVPFPPLPEQKRIAAILTRADRLRRLRRYARELSDTYLQSVFLEMFGDPVSNPMGWDFRFVREICNLVRGSSPRPQGDPRYFGGPVPRLMIADITRDGMFVTPTTDSLTEEGAKKSRPMKAGSVVMAVSGAVGLPAILNVDACIHDGFVGFRKLDRQLLPIYFSYLLATLRAVSQSQATGAIWQNLTTDQIRMWQVPCPPLSLQQKFANIVHQFERLRAQQREAERQAEHLFQTLLHRAFRGEV